MLRKMMGIGLVLAVPAWAGSLYAHNASDLWVYSDQPFLGAQKIANLPQKNHKTAQHASAHRPNRVIARANMATFVPSGTQQRRDAQRQAILQDELAQEHAALKRAQASLKFTPKNEIARVQESISMHRQNIAAIREEMSRIR